MNIVEKARNFALIAHGSQVYDPGIPYQHHLEQAVAVLRRFYPEAPDTLVAATWLHDVIEDTKTSYRDLEMAFGYDVAEVVYAVTDELGRNRAERKAKTMPKVAAGGTRTCIVKYADRIANVENALARGVEKKVKMYQEELTEFLEGAWPVGVGGREDRVLAPSAELSAFFAMQGHLRRLLA